MTRLSQLFVSKHRKICFEVALIIKEVVNIPLLGGYYYVDWKLQNASDSAGTTQRIYIENHRVIWNCLIDTTIKIVIDKKQILSYTELKLDIYQQSKKHRLGTVSINLAEFAGRGTVTERYLLQDCKFNATLKITISMVGKKVKPVPSVLQMTQKAAIVPQNNFTEIAAANRSKPPHYRLPSPSRPARHFLGVDDPIKEIIRASKKSESALAFPNLAASPQFNSPNSVRFFNMIERRYRNTLQFARPCHKGPTIDIFDDPHDVVEKLFARTTERKSLIPTT